MNAKPVLYDLGVSLGAISLWLTPFDFSRAVGYAVSIVFSGRAYLTGVSLLTKEQRDDEKEGITYEAEVDFYDQLLGNQVDSVLEIKMLEIENKTLERLIPLAAYKQQLEKQIEQVSPTHPELSNEDREQAAKTAIDNAFEGGESKEERFSQISEEDIRKQFPEQMDSTTWRAVLKALGNGASKQEIIRDVLQADNEIGKAYYELLKNKFA